MSYAVVTLKSGAEVEFDCTEVNWTGKTNLLGEVILKRLDWETPAGAVRRILHIDVEEIAAVVFVDTGDIVSEIEVERDALRDRVALLERQIAQHSCEPRGLADLS